MRTKRAAPDLPASVPVVLAPEHIAEALGISIRTLRRMRANSEFPDPDLYVAGMGRWKPTTLGAWIDRQPKNPNNARRLPA